MTEIRHVVADEVPQLATVLAAAFADDPLMGWIYPDAATRSGFATAWFEQSLRQGLARGHTYTADGDRGVAIWSPPDVPMFNDADGLALYELFSAQLGEATDRTLTGLMEVSAAHPHAMPHFYLFIVGVQPDARGRGLASALITEILDRCDRQGLGAYLESSSPANVPLYERHGFHVTAEVTLPDGPTIRPMWRDPR